VAYGSAHILPFHLLPWRGRPLVATHAVRRLHSASVLQFLAPSDVPAPEGVLAVGNPSHIAYTTDLAG
jgi:hypothetical protein